MSITLTICIIKAVKDEKMTKKTKKSADIVVGVAAAV
jgi:hypothetical protein